MSIYQQPIFHIDIPKRAVWGRMEIWMHSQKDICPWVSLEWNSVCFAGGQWAVQTIGIMANVNEIRGCVYNYLPPGIKGLPQNMSNASIFSNESKSKTFKKKSKTIQEERIATKHEQCVNNSFGLVLCKLTQKLPTACVINWISYDFKSHYMKSRRVVRKFSHITL